MSRNRRVVLALLSGLLLSGFLLAWRGLSESPSLEARQKLDSLLGEFPSPRKLPPDNSMAPIPGLPDTPGSPALSDPLAAESPDSPLAQIPGWGQGFFGLNLPGSGAEVEETDRVYRLHVPLAEPGDADSVKLNVTPSRIEISGRTGSRRDGVSITSSFMQSFNTSTEVLPDQISRQTEKKGEQIELVITIPKKAGGASAPAKTTPAQPSTSPHSPSATPTPGSLDGDPFEDHQHQVI